MLEARVFRFPHLLRPTSLIHNTEINSIPHSYLIGGGAISPKGPEADGPKWYIPEEDQHFFSPGQIGRYQIGRDDQGRYLETQHGKFYLGHSDMEDLNINQGAFHGSANQSVLPNRETKVFLRGRHVLVPVRIRHKGRTLTLKLLLDTGASLVTLHKNAVKRLHFSNVRRVHFSSASGQTIPADLVELQEIRFGPIRKKNMAAGIIDYHQSGVRDYDGLLGMNALQGLDYRVDYDKQTIRWFAAPGF